MESSKKHTAGSIKVSEEVILKIAETAACEIEGVASKGQRLEPPSAMARLRGPVRARILGEAAAIKFDISVVDGYNAVKVAESIQRSVKSAVQNMTGFTVTKVDVNIAGVSYGENDGAAAEQN
ncbi:MAG: Asp23/Gls24 family envelope stress response protein [Lachnospiraceae bacterium]|nr:Asp23/Gls24 family envelope stress response protein [Ruminococcus sp.]MCM1273913.1 Asp23/Gls24 family envelope stress response protein [Lachnospiraceae bacterium]